MTTGAAETVDAALEPTSHSFQGVIRGGLIWKARSRILFEFTKIAVAVVLARMLTPHDYGLAGMVLILVAFEPTLSGTALASALIQRRSLEPGDRSTVFWTNVGVASACTLTCCLAAGWVARFYGAPEVRWLFASVSFVFVISALGSAHSAMLVRDLNFKGLELRSMAGMVIGAGTAVAVAAAGYGPWALVAQALATYTFSTAFMWLFSPWRPRFTYSRRSIRKLRRFGGDVSGTLLLFQLNQTTDNVLVGRFLGASALGAYSLAYNIILVPFSRLASPLHEVLYPVFTRLQDDTARVGAIWLRAVRVLAALAIPAMLGLVVVAPDFVHVVFGSRWHAATPVVQILAWVGLLFALQGLNSVVLQALGRTGVLLCYSMVSFAAGLLSFIIGLRWGIVGVAACFAVVSTIIQPTYMAITARATGLTLLDCIRALAGIAEASAAVLAAALACRYLVLHAGLPPFARLLTTALAGGAAYVAVFQWRCRDILAEAKMLRRSRALDG